MLGKLVRLLARYAQGALALPAQGFLGWMGFAKETTWGTAVAATDYTELLSENVSFTQDRFDVKNIHGRYSEPDDMYGVGRVAGDIVLPAYPIVTGALLKGAMQTVSGSVVLSGFLFNTRFVTKAGDFASGVPNQPYTFEVFRDVTSSQRYAGCMVNRLQFAAAPNAPLRVTANIIGQAMANIAKSTQTLPSSPLDPFAFDTASIQVAGAATARMEAFNLSIDNQLEGIPVLNNSRSINKIRHRGFQMIRVSGTYDFADITEYLDFVNQTERAMVASFTRADSFQLVFDLPRVVYTAFPQGMPGRERLTVAFEGIGRFHTNSNTALGAYLTSTRSNY